MAYNKKWKVTKVGARAKYFKTKSSAVSYARRGFRKGRLYKGRKRVYY